MKSVFALTLRVLVHALAVLGTAVMMTSYVASVDTTIREKTAQRVPYVCAVHESECPDCLWERRAKLRALPR